MVDYARLLAEKAERNVDNVARTASYLELYALARDNGEELPWLLMAHLVSRHAGYLMTDVAAQLETPTRVFTREALYELFAFLERANFLIFDDAWHHALCHLLGRAKGARTARFMAAAWARYESERYTPESERRLVLDLVTNEQRYIENRVVKSARFARARAMVGFFEAIGAERPITLPLTDARITVGRFADVERRIETGRRIFDAILADRVAREAAFAWAKAHPHVGSQRVLHPRAKERTLREAWPIERVRAIAPGVHAPPEPDAAWP